MGHLAAASLRLWPPPDPRVFTAVEQADRRGRTPVHASTTAPDVEDDCDTTDTDGGGGVGADLVGIAVDGKTVRGAKRTDGTQVQLLAAFRHDTGMVIGQRNVENEKTNEILAFAPLLAPVALSGRVVIADAMHTQRKAAEVVIGRCGHYIFGVKGHFGFERGVGVPDA